jgi:hypothetical protein
MPIAQSIMVRQIPLAFYHLYPHSLVLVIFTLAVGGCLEDWQENRILIPESDLDDTKRGDVPDFRFTFTGSGAAPGFKNSTGGWLYQRFDGGRSMHTFRLERLGTQFDFSFEYWSVYKHTNPFGDNEAHAEDGAECPGGVGLSHYIKRFAIKVKPGGPTAPKFRLAYRCWVSAYKETERYDPDPGPGFYVGDGSYVGTQQDDYWVTAVEMKLSRSG